MYNLTNYDDYIKKVDYYINTDCRELNFQNRIIIPFLETVFSEEKNVSIVDISMQYRNRNSKLHTRDPYANEYTPDLLIAQNWNYQNKVNDVKYLSVVEIKIPDCIDTSQIRKYFNFDGRKVIWTNCFVWKFFINGEEVLPPINLKDENKNWKQGDSDWNHLSNSIKNFIAIDKNGVI